RKDRELRSEFFAVALWTLGFVLAKHEGFELVFALPAYVFKNRHKCSLNELFQYTFKLKSWRIRNFSHDEGYGADTARPLPASSCKGESVFLFRKNAWLKWNRGYRCCATAIGRQTDKMH